MQETFLRERIVFALCEIYGTFHSNYVGKLTNALNLPTGSPPPSLPSPAWAPSSGWTTPRRPRTTRTLPRSSSAGTEEEEEGWARSCATTTLAPPPPQGPPSGGAAARTTSWGTASPSGRKQVYSVFPWILWIRFIIRICIARNVSQV